MKRRSFLRTGLLGGLVVLGGTACCLGLKKNVGAALPKQTLRVIRPELYAVLVAIAARVVAAPGRDASAIAIGVDQALTFANAAAQQDFNRLLALLQNSLAGLLLRGTTTPFTDMSPAEQDRVLYGMRDSSIAALRGAFGAMRKLCAASYFADAKADAVLGYPGPPFEKPDPGPIGQRRPLSPPFVVSSE